MLLSDSVACLLQVPPVPTLKSIQEKIDPDYFLELKEHLQLNIEYRKERKEFYKLHPSWCIYRARDEFARQYIETFHRDIEFFVKAHPDLSIEESTRAFCQKWRGYANLYGEEFVRRAITRL